MASQASGDSTRGVPDDIFDSTGHISYRIHKSFTTQDPARRPLFQVQPEPVFCVEVSVCGAKDALRPILQRGPVE